MNQLLPRERWISEMMNRQAASVARLTDDAIDRCDPVDHCLAWLVVEREAQRYLRRLEVWGWFRAGGPLDEAMAAQERVLAAYLRRAESELRGQAPELIRQARQQLSIRVAIVGKGGAGKTVVASTVARLLARRGRKVIAADLDPCPGLAMSIGLPPSVGGLPPNATEQADGPPQGWYLAGGLTPLDAVKRFSVPGPDGVCYLGVGKVGRLADERFKRSITAITQGVLLGLTEPDWDVIADLEAGVTQSFQGHHSFCDRVVLVVGPAWRSALTARRLLPMFGDREILIVGNRFRHEPDPPGLPLLVRIPEDPAVADAERRGFSPVDACPGSPAIEAIEDLTRRLLAEVAVA